MNTDRQSRLRGLTVVEAAHQLGIGRTVLSSLINDGFIRPLKLGRRTVIPQWQVEALLESGITSPIDNKGV